MQELFIFYYYFIFFKDFIWEKAREITEREEEGEYLYFILILPLEYSYYNY